MEEGPLAVRAFGTCTHTMGNTFYTKSAAAKIRLARIQPG
jgi:hypothetical protein